jgi:8-oxo-dGTP pyrophosphatase MutT (NUDIX family)
MVEALAVQSLVAGWQEASDGEAWKSRELMLHLLRETPYPFARNQFSPGHVTATACVLHPAEAAVLLVHHRRLDRWLLPGGHVEVEIDTTIAASARREAVEETGVLLDAGTAPVLVGLDVHGIPARKKEPFHLHHDLIFRFRAVSAVVEGSDEVRATLWCPVDRFDNYAVPEPIRRAVQRSLAG